MRHQARDCDCCPAHLLGSQAFFLVHHAQLELLLARTKQRGEIHADNAQRFCLGSQAQLQFALVSIVMRHHRVAEIFKQWWTDGVRQLDPLYVLRLKPPRVAITPQLKLRAALLHLAEQL